MTLESSIVENKNVIVRRKHSQETIKKMIAAKMGHKVSEKTRAKMRAALKGRKRPTMSEEWKAKLSAANKGRILTEEWKAKIGAASKGRKWSEEAKIKLSGENNTGWKGDNVGRSAIHNWVRKHWPTSIPTACQNCNRTVTSLDLVCMTKLYTRNFSDWKFLCRKCHGILDCKIKNKGPCSKCGSNETYMTKGSNKPVWRRSRMTGSIICFKCYHNFPNY